MKISYKIYNFFFICLTAITFVGCEEVIDLKLKNIQPKLVIEAIITDSLQIQTVIVSQTINFDAKNQLSPVSGATIQIVDMQNTVIGFVENLPGIYQTLTPVKGIPGKNYNIVVKVNNQTYLASSTMPQAVKIDSLRQTNLTFFRDLNKFTVVNYQDPAGVPNYYNNRLYVNGQKRSQFYVEFDRFNDGKPVKNTIFNDEPDLVTGDKIKIEMLTIDVNVYKYLFAITQIGGNGGPPTAPANPVSNFSNGALGYFSASTLSVDSMVVK